MGIVTLGTGGPSYNPNRNAPSQVIIVKGEPLLIDCGRGVVGQLVKAGIQHKDIEYVFVTHHHFDHISELDDFVLHSWVNKRIKPLTIYGPKGTVELIETLFKKIYKMDIEHRLGVFQISGRKLVWNDPKANDIGDGLVCETDNWKVTSAFVDHWRTCMPDFDYDALAFRVDSDEGSIVSSGDCIPCESLVELARNADILVQDCRPRVAYKYVHASSEDVGKLATAASVKKIVLTHMPAFDDSPELRQKMVEDVKRDFNGEIVMSEDLMRITVG